MNRWYVTSRKYFVIRSVSSVMASSLLRSITDFLETNMDEEINSLYDTTLGDSCEDLGMLERRNSRSVEIR